MNSARFLVLVDPQQRFDANAILSIVDIQSQICGGGSQQLQLNIAAVASNTLNFAGAWSADIPYISAVCKSLSAQLSTTTQFQVRDISPVLFSDSFLDNLLHGVLAGSDNFRAVIVYNGSVSQEACVSISQRLSEYFSRRAVLDMPNTFFHVRLFALEDKQPEGTLDFVRNSQVYHRWGLLGNS
jgi:hypothetical protein